MVKAFVFYDSKYGNTKLAAEKIAEGLQAEGVEADLGYVKEVDLQEAICVDIIVLGAPNHMGRPSRTMKSFVERLSGYELKAKAVAVFGTYSGKERSPDRAVKKLEAMALAKFTNWRLAVPSLSVRVNGVKGPVAEGELAKCVDFGKRIATQLKAKTIM